MGAKEVIWRLKEHLKAQEKMRGRLCKVDKNFGITYVMDFLLLPRDKAKQFLKENIPSVMEL